MCVLRFRWIGVSSNRCKMRVSLGNRWDRYHGATFKKSAGCANTLRARCWCTLSMLQEMSPTRQKPKGKKHKRNPSVQEWMERMRVSDLFFIFYFLFCCFLWYGLRPQPSYIFEATALVLCLKTSSSTM